MVLAIQNTYIHVYKNKIKKKKAMKRLEVVRENGIYYVIIKLLCHTDHRSFQPFLPTVKNKIKNAYYNGDKKNKKKSARIPEINILFLSKYHYHYGQHLTVA